MEREHEERNERARQLLARSGVGVGTVTLARTRLGDLHEVEVVRADAAGVELAIVDPRIPRSLRRAVWATTWLGLQRARGRV